MLIERDDLIYAAGIIDGEGYIGSCLGSVGAKKKRPTYTTRVSILNTNRHVIEWLARLFPTKVFYRNYVRGNRKPQWACYWDGPRGAELLRQILPFLRIKREQAVFALNYQQIVGRLRDKMGVRKFPSLPPGVAILRDRTLERLKYLNAFGQGWAEPS